jgi:outer membrane receptor protein involved in Fe transport
MNVDLSYGKVETINRTGASDAQNIYVAGDNAYALASPAISSYINGLLGDGDTTTEGRLNKDWTSQVDSYSRFTTKVKRAAIGFDGTFGDTSWGWEGYYQYGETDREQYVNDNRHLIAYNMAVDAVQDASGNIVCRVTRDGYAAAAAANNGKGGYANVDPRMAIGCVPLNAFGNGPISQAAHDYAFGFLDENLNYKQQVLALNVSGDLFDGFGAGAVQGALGAEYRTEKGENLAAQGVPDYVRTDYNVQYGESFAGDVDVTEGYTELNIPVLKNAVAAKKLDFNVAARISRYDNQGKEGTSGLSETRNLFTWKAQGIWDPLDWLRIRATQSRDARAPNFRELYYRQVINQGGQFGYCGPTGTQIDPCVYDLNGNVNLEPEKSDTTTIGFVFQPTEVNFQFAADYFRINVKDSINQASSRVVLDGCNGGQGPASFCTQLQTAVPGDYTDITRIVGLAYNGAGYTYKGVDFTSNYLVKLDDASNINFRLIATRMIDQKFQQTLALPVYNIVGQTGTANSFLADNQPSPTWNGSLSATYNRGPLAVTGQMRYVSAGTFNSRAVAPGDAGYPNGFILGGTSLDQNRVPSYQLFTLSANYTFDNLFHTDTIQIFGVVANLFDKDPPIAVGNGANGSGGTNPIYFDTMGRAYRVGVRATF